jgi:hypothetical protein
VDIVLTVQSRNQGYERFAELTFDDFRRMATDDSLSNYEKIGFPDEYREGSEEAIFEDILAKLPALTRTQRTILDIGPGCSDLPRMLDELCQRQDHTLILIDSGEMLDHHPDRPGLRKAPGSFPECADDLADSRGAVDAILAYSVLHYVFPEGSVFGFLDRAIELLAPGGTMLIGDIPNTSKRKRFFSSAAGREFHRQFTGRDEDPVVDFGGVERDRIDDSVVLGMLGRARAAGCDAYVVAQRDDLPLANRREDLLIRKP